MVYQPVFKLRKFLEKCIDQPIICNNGFANRTFIEFLTKIKLSSMIYSVLWTLLKYEIARVHERSAIKHLIYPIANYIICAIIRA